MSLSRLKLRLIQIRSQRRFSAFVFLLAAFVSFVRVAMAQGHFILNNRVPPAINAPFILTDPATGEPGEPSYKGKPLSYWLIEFRGSPLNRGLGRANNQLAREAIAALGVGAVPFILQYSDTNQVRAGGIIRQALAELVIQGHSIPVDQIVFRSLQSTNATVRKNAFEALPCAALQDHLQILLDAVRGEDQELRRVSLATFSRCATSSPELIPYWVAQLDSPNESDQREALDGLKALGAGAKSALPKIGEVLQRANPRTLVQAADALWAIDRQTNALPTLAKELLRSHDWMFIRETLQLFREMGPAAQSAAPAILARFDLPNTNVAPEPMFLRRAARETLQIIDPGSEEKLPREMQLPKPGEFRIPPPPPIPSVPPMPLG